MKTRALLLAFLATGFALATATAELPPGSYDELRKEAQEALIIDVLEVRQKMPAGDGPASVIVKAKVLSVERSKANLKKGDTIQIEYESFVKPPTGFVGPKPVPLLKEGQVVPAFLNAMGKSYTPAAHGWSFVMTPEK